MEGRLRTASNPSNTWILSAEYVELLLFSSLIIVFKFVAQRYVKSTANEIGSWWCGKYEIFILGLPFELKND